MSTYTCVYTTKANPPPPTLEARIGNLRDSNRADSDVPWVSFRFRWSIYVVRRCT